MNEEEIYDEFVSETNEYAFPACRYLKDGEVIGDNIDIFIDVTYGNPEVVGVNPEDDFWVATIIKDGIEQDKKFVVIDYDVLPDGILPYSEYPEIASDGVESSMGTHTSVIYPGDAEGATDVVGGVSEFEPIDDTEDVQTEDGDDGVDVDLGENLVSEGSFDDLPDETIPLDDETSPEGVETP